MASDRRDVDLDCFSRGYTLVIGLRRNVFGTDVVSLARSIPLCRHAPVDLWTLLSLPDPASSFRLALGGISLCSEGH